MTRTSTSAPADQQRDAMNEPRGVVTAILWAGGWLAAVVAVAVTAISAATALKLTGVPDPGPITTYGLPTLTAIGEFGAAIALGSAVFAAFFVPPQTDHVLDVGGYRAIRVAATASLVWSAPPSPRAVGESGTTTSRPHRLLRGPSRRGLPAAEYQLYGRDGCARHDGARGRARASAGARPVIVAVSRAADLVKPAIQIDTEKYR